jgi:hypothetical protein
MESLKKSPEVKNRLGKEAGEPEIPSMCRMYVKNVRVGVGVVCGSETGMRMGK